MEEKQLDFNQPFLSARRYSAVPVPAEAREQRRKVDSTRHKLPPLPPYKSELKSGPVSKPGRVPFVWERIPGKPKEEKEFKDCIAVECPPAAPKLPPGRSLKVELDSGKNSKVVAEIDPQRKNKTQSIAQEVANHGDRQEEDIGDKGSSSSEESDEAFLDARDTFSRTDSFFLNSSVVSALSGLDGIDSRSPERFDTDPVAWDFMMGRFLPAAKAMTSAKPHHVTRKPLPVAQEIPGPEKVSRAEKVSDDAAKEHCPVLDQNKPKIPLRNVLEGYGEESEDDDWDEYDNSLAKVCGLLPRFCILNPVPGIKTMQHPRPPSAGRVQAKSSHTASIAENRTKRTPCKELEEHGLDSGRKLREVKSLYRRLQGNVQCLNSKEVSLQAAFQAEGSTGKAAQKLDNSSTDGGSSPYKRLQGNGQYLNSKEVSLRDAFQAEGSIEKAVEKLDNASTDGGPNPQGKRFMNFRELLASEGSGWESHSTDLIVEKTLYVDSVQLVKSQKSDSCPSDSKGLNNRDSLPENGAALSKSAGQETQQFDLPNEKSGELEQQKSTEFSPFPSGKSGHEAHIDPIKSSTTDQEPTMEGKAKNCKDACSNGKVYPESELATKAEGREISLINDFNLHLPPPLPKSPSDSWLSRTLLSVSSKSSASPKTPLGTNIPLSRRAIVYKSSLIEAKWETIVRTSNIHPGHLRSSKELLPPIPDA